MEFGGKDYAKKVILYWITEAGDSSMKLLETVTGLPQKILSVLLTEMVAEGSIQLDMVIFRLVRG